MKLGEKILQELDAARTDDTLTRWLAHHITELITTANRTRATGTADEATYAAEQCRRAILDLWEHRTAWPSGWPPPGVKQMAEILNSINAPTFGFQQGSKLSQLQRLHHEVLAALADEETMNETVDTAQSWLESYGQLLDVDERELLELYAGRDDRAATPIEVPRAERPTDAHPRSDGQAGRTPQVHRVLDLVRRYHETVRSLLADEAEDMPTKPH
ncbi:hypothetical protein OG345_04920 [Streptomyces sp. NBC_01220]|uniref:hypothetical protein n=1 Tax=Streptomyces sp. NBC_01220 TaxID=2903781 RepID=UPI00352E81E5|nr:hypothetical protein OG345_04920 [Streptomyces sp. NBC_01220]